MKRCLLSLLSVVVVGVGADAAAPQRISGIYSNLRYVAEAGDLLGMELMVIPSGDGGGGYSVFVQIAQGAAPDASITKFEVDGRKIAFEMPENSAYAGRKLAGTLTATGMRVKWDSGNVEVLRRGKSYWQ